MNTAMFQKIDKHANVKTIVLAPFLVLLLYYGLIASDRYTSEAIVTVKENNANTTGLDIGLLGIGGSSSNEDEFIIQEYLQSYDALEYLDKTLKTREHFQSSEADWLSALADGATKEEYLEYFRNHIAVHFDEITGLLHIEVQAFDNAYAKRLLDELLKHTEDVVNKISHDLALAQYEFVEEQLKATQESLKHAKQNLLAFQDQYQTFSPEQQSQSLTAILDGLEGELAKERTRLKEILSYQKKSSMQVLGVKDRINALSKQIADEKLRLIGKDPQSLNDLMAQFTNLQLDLEFAKNAYAASLAALEQSRAEASKKIKHLVVVSRPTLAEEAKYPDRIYVLITALIVLSMMFGIVRMALSTIREHQD